MNIAPQSYYDEVIALFAASGMVLLSQVAVDTTDLPYFIAVTYAKHTSLVFYAPGKSCMLRLCHHETAILPEDPDKFQQYWSMAIEVMYESIDEREACKNAPGMMRMDRDDYPALEPHFPNFYHCGWSSREGLMHRWNAEQKTTFKVRMQPSELYGYVMPTVDKLLPFLSSQPWPNLHLDWAPTYTFSGPHQHDNRVKKQACEDLFWSRVNKSTRDILKTLIVKIYP